MDDFVPEMEAQLNRQFETTLKVNELAVPVWHPRVKIWPEQLRLDNHGLTMVLGATFARMGDPPADFSLRQYQSKLTDRFATLETGVAVAVSEHFVPAYTELMVAGGVNDLHAVDFRLKEFDALNDLTFLRQVIPDLVQFGDDIEANVSFQMLEPARFGDIERGIESPAGNPAQSAVSMGVIFPKLRTLISTRRPGERTWTRYVVVDHIVSRDYLLSVIRGGYAARAVLADVVSEMRFQSTAHFVEGYVPQNPEILLDPLHSQLNKALVKACGERGSLSFTAKDFDLLGVPLRLESVDRSEGLLFVQQQVPGIVVNNSSTEPMTYRVREPFAHWSALQQIAPGERFEHHARYPLIWQSQHSGQTLTYTLPLGREAAFRDQPHPGLNLVTDTLEQTDEPQQGLMLNFLGY